jgi:hypothetical protein
MMYDQDNEEGSLLESRSARIESLSSAILETRDEDVEARAASGIERLWREDQRMYDGMDGTENKTNMLDVATGESWPGKNSGEKRRSKVVLNLIRSKCETKEARFDEIQFPTDDKNWGLKHTPVPEPAIDRALLASQPAQPQQEMVGMNASQIRGMGEQGAPDMGMAPQGLMGGLPAKSVDDMDKRTSAMEEEINDQLTECDYNTEGRKVARQAIRLGTGVLKGPNVIKSLKKVWIEQKDDSDSVHILKIIEEQKPASKWVDVWNVYPDANCDGDISKMSRIWERDSITRASLKDLIGVDGYDSHQIMKILEEDPIRTRFEQDKGGVLKKTASTIKKGAPYEKWEYYGDANKELLEIMGCPCHDKMPSRVSVCAVFVNDRPIKIQLNMLDTGDIPYDFFQWHPQSDSIWGLSEPRRLMWPQRIGTGALRMMMDNGGDAAGRQIIMNDSVEPENGSMEYENNKFWINTDSTVPANHAFAQFQLQNNQQQYENIINIALKLADMESGTPALAQGAEKGWAPETFGGMKMLMNNSDANVRRQVKQWDDQITRRHLRRYYDWNMQYNPKDEIKGDMRVDPRGVSVLLVKDDNVQKLMGVFQLRNDPEVNIQVDWSKVIEQLFKAQHLDVLKSEEEIKAARDAAANQPQPTAPQIEAAKIRVEGDMQKAQMNHKSDMSELQLKEKMETTSMLLKHKMMEAEHQHQMQIEQLHYQIKMMELSQAQGISLDSIKAALASDAMKLKTQKELSELSMLSDHVKQKNEHANTMASTPLTEPVGRADPGHAYEQ